jgi:hypothetical protein
MTLSLLIAIAISVISGSMITVLIYRFTHASARLIVDTSDPEKDVFKLDIFDLEVLRKKKYLEVRIVNRSLK